ncbi:transposase family protein [Streptomyces sp. NPDC001276]|uniref:transposase family protein n=1 Tax=Streptomyces sp. NPDC001276 TaxID=3364555 RepID=UPI00369189E1
MVLVRARASAERAPCPACGTVSARVHSRYVRRLAGTAVGGRPVMIELQVRRFRCRQRSCTQATFAEQVDGLIQNQRSAVVETRSTATPPPPSVLAAESHQLRGRR